MNFKEAIRALLSGVLLVIALGPWKPVTSDKPLAILAWIAWMPILGCLLPIDSKNPCRRPFQTGWIMGLVFWFGTLFWLVHVTVAGMIALAVYLALYFSAWTFFVAWLHGRWSAATGPAHIGLALAGASAWVSLEWLRGRMLGGFPWNFAAVTQHRNLVLIQIAEWTGVYGVSFVLVFFNIALWLTWRRLRIEKFSARSWRYEFSLAILLVALCLMVGMRRLLAEQKNGDGKSFLRIALIQPAVPQEVKYEAISFSEQQDRLRHLTLAAAAAKPDLIIWPETALVNGPNHDQESHFWLQTLIREVKTPILLGTLDAPPWFLERDKRSRPRWLCNAAMLVDVNGNWETPYHKLHLVPFGEYVPFERWLPWMRYLTPIQGSFESGKKTVCFDFKGMRLGPLICFEDTFPHLARNLNRAGADVLINLTNDAWFKDSPGAAMHLANAVFRTIENRRPLARCTNHGVTCIVDSMGRIQPQQILKPFAKGFLITEIAWHGREPATFYGRHGDWFAFGCGLSSVATLLIGRRSRAPDSQASPRRQ